MDAELSHEDEGKRVEALDLRFWIEVASLPKEAEAAGWSFLRQPTKLQMWIIGEPRPTEQMEGTRRNHWNLDL